MFRRRTCRYGLEITGCVHRFTYNEPNHTGRYIIDICKEARNYGLKTVMVTNGYITYDAFPRPSTTNIDCCECGPQAFHREFLRKNHTDAFFSRCSRPLAWLKKETKVWFDIIMMSDELNDDPAETRKLARMYSDPYWADGFPRFAMRPRL